MKGSLLSIIFSLALGVKLLSQDSLNVSSQPVNIVNKIFSGFVRGGFYSWIDNTDNKLYIPSAFSDFGLKFETGNVSTFRAFADLRLRYGTEFEKPVSNFDLREAFVTVNGKKWSVTAGQKIIKWGRCDFTNPTSKLNPRNLVSRSPDREDMDMGNLLADINLYPSSVMKLEGVLIPYYRSSVLIIDPVPLPENVKVNQITSLITDKEMFSYGLKADFHLANFDWSLSWFDGYDPLPGIALTDFQLDLSQPFPVPYTELSVKPYKTRVAGFDFETTAGSVSIRGEAALSEPYLPYTANEWVALPEIKWATGFDFSRGVFRFIAEYNGKYVLDFTPSPVDPIIGTQPDYSKIAEMMAVPGFDLEEYVRQQVAAFNRLYNYQLEEFYHSAGLKVEADMFYGKLVPSVFSMYNFTSGDFLVIPELKIKPADGIAISVGAEVYTGRSGSLYDLVNDFLDGVYISMRVDF